jgi:hypothetical protein
MSATSRRNSPRTASSASRTGLSGEKSATRADAPSRRTSTGTSAGPPSRRKNGRPRARASAARRRRPRRRNPSWRRRAPRRKGRGNRANAMAIGAAGADAAARPAAWRRAQLSARRWSRSIQYTTGPVVRPPPGWRTRTRDGCTRVELAGAVAGGIAAAWRRKGRVIWEVGAVLEGWRLLYATAVRWRGWWCIDRVLASGAGVGASCGEGEATSSASIGLGHVIYVLDVVLTQTQRK